MYFSPDKKFFPAKYLLPFSGNTIHFFCKTIFSWQITGKGKNGSFPKNNPTTKGGNMKKLVRFAATILAAGALIGCQAKEACDSKKKENCPAGCVKKAVTPAGEVIYIFAVWDATSRMKDPKNKPCPNTQCWKTGDGKVWCAKPIALCPGKKGNCKGDAKAHIQNKKGVVMCGITPGAAVDGKVKNWCVKQVKECKEKNPKLCPAAEHVQLMNGKKACAPKADKKAAKEISAAGTPPTASDVIEEDSIFLVTAN